MLRTRRVFDFNRVIKKGCTEKVTFEQRPEGGEGGSSWDMTDRGNSKCKGPEVETAGALEKVSEAGAE